MGAPQHIGVVGKGDDGPSPVEQVGEQRIDRRGPLRVQALCGLVEDHQPPARRQAPRQGETAANAESQRASLVDNGGLQPLWRILHEGPEPRFAHHPVEALVVEVGVGDADVLGQGAVQEQRLLGHIDHLAPPPFRCDLPEVHAVRQHLSPTGIEKSDQKPRERRLAAAVGALHHQHAARFQRQVQAFEQGAAGPRPGEGHVLEFDASLVVGQGRALGCLPWQAFELTQQVQGLARLDQGLGQLAHRDHRLQGLARQDVGTDHRADGELALHHQKRADGHHRDGQQAIEGVVQGLREVLVAEDSPAQAFQRSHLLRPAPPQVRLGVEGAHRLRPADRPGKQGIGPARGPEHYQRRFAQSPQAADAQGQCQRRHRRCDQGQRRAQKIERQQEQGDEWHIHQRQHAGGGERRLDVAHAPGQFLRRAGRQAV